MAWDATARLPVALDVAAGTAVVVDLMDETAFHAFYQRTARPLWAYIRRVTGDGTVADDVVQTAFCRLLASPPADADESNLRAYVFRIASNLAVDHWRRAKRERSEPVPERAPGMAADARLVAHIDLARTFARLEPRERAMLWLAYVEGSNHREIAASLGVKEGSVRVLLSRARKRLAGLLSRRDREAGGR
jgi:RNA polymerase sigma-70 factor (ECF subfamily)